MVDDMGEAADKALEDFKRDFKAACRTMAQAIEDDTLAVLPISQVKAIVTALTLVKPND